jgi:hypothetical protein
MKISEQAYVYGQLFTNVTKATLLQLSLASSSLGSELTLEKLRECAERVLAKSDRVPANYRFNNQFAYEELSYVYQMLRQIFNWRRLHEGSAEVKPLASLVAEGFAWHCVGGPFKVLL